MHPVRSQIAGGGHGVSFLISLPFLAQIEPLAFWPCSPQEFESNQAFYWQTDFNTR
jgi:hypothetical protein